MNISKNNKDQYTILVNNINILNNIDKDYSDKCMIIYDYLMNLRIEYDSIFLLDKIKKYNYKLYKDYLRMIDTMYENLHTNNLYSNFDDYEGNNIWNKDTLFYCEIYSLLSKYNNVNI